MTDLSAKFQGLRQDETDSIRQTNTLLAAIKGDGPDSLVDLASALNLNTQTLVDIRTLLEGLQTTIELLNNNASTNAQQTISAVINSSCGCDTVLPDPPFDSGTGELDCASELVESLKPFETSTEHAVTLPENIVQFGPPRTIGETDVIFFARFPSDESKNIAVSLDECPYYGDVVAGEWQVSIINNSDNNVGSQPVGWCWIDSVPAPDTKCARAQAIVAGFTAIVAAFSRMSDGQTLTNTAINLAWAYGSPYIEARNPDSLTRQNLINLYVGANGGFHYGLLPSGFAETVQNNLISAINGASNAENAGIAFLDVLEVQSGLDAPYLDFIKSIPQQFWFNAAFDEGSTALNYSGFDNDACTS